MNRFTRQNADSPEYVEMVLQLAPMEIEDWKKTGIHSPPQGFVGFAELKGEEVVIKIRTVIGKAAKNDPSFTAKSIEELRTMAAKAGKPYTAETTKAELIAALK